MAHANEPWFFRGAVGSHAIPTKLGVIGVGVCNDNHRSYLPRRLQQEDVDLVLMPHCWPLPMKAGGAISEADIQRWHRIQMEMAPLYARVLGVPAVFVNKVGPYASPAPLRWLPRATDMVLPGHATIADSDGTVKGRLDDSEGVLTGIVTLDPARKVRVRPPTYGRYTYPSGLGGLLALAPAWVCGRIYALNPDRRRRARHVAATDEPGGS
jgi:N-carbamoylputrescine amidase